MRRFLVIISLFICIGCSKSTEPVSNVATEYSKSLQQDVVKAQQAAEKANAAIAVEQSAAAQAANLE